MPSFTSKTVGSSSRLFPNRAKKPSSLFWSEPAFSVKAASPAKRLAWRRRPRLKTPALFGREDSHDRGSSP